jgi:signal transduction histidine kinase
MRNPLLVIMHLAHSIIGTSEQSQTNGVTPQGIEDILEAARIIEVCTKHQQHILDCVLMLGRMESALLSINPEPFSIEFLCQSILSMFKLQTQRSRITTKLKTK